MGKAKLYDIWPLNRDHEYASIEPSAPEHRIPEIGIAYVPGYSERGVKAMRGEIEPWWGTEYESDGVFPAEFVNASPYGHAVSNRLRTVFEENAVSGVRFHRIVVDGSVPMNLMIVTGRVGIDAKAFELSLLDGAEVGFHKGVQMYVGPRVVKLVRKAGVACYYRCLVAEPHDSIPRWKIRRSPR